MRVLHIISGLNDGGAEAILYRLCLHDKKNSHTVISLMDEGKYGSLLRDAGVDVHCLDIPQSRITPRGILALYRLIRLIKPDAVQTWMFHADLVGGVTAKLAGFNNITWGIHTTTLDSKKSKRSTILTTKLCAKLSWVVPKKIACCAHKSLEVHRALGYDPKKMIVVNNGYDLSQFFIDPTLGRHVRQELFMDESMPLLGMVGRFDPQKDHANLLSALVIVKKSNTPFKCLLVGSGLNPENATLKQWLIEKDLIEDVLLLGQRPDVPAIMNALDIHVLSSAYGEAFPNVLNEAMACGTPCVTTDQGDSALIVDQTGWVVPSNNPPALAAAILSALQEKRDNPHKWATRQEMARKRVQDNFSIETMIAKYQAVWSE